jgi:DNA-binding transcriptional LysR family regulator
VLSHSAAPRGLVRIAAPMSFGVAHLAPLLPEMLAALPEVTIDLHLSDARVDLVADGFDVAVRVAAMEDSSLRVRRICAVRRILVGAPAYFAELGHPAHPHQLARHRCLSYSYLPTPDRWRFQHASGEVVTVTPAGPLRINNGDALTPSVLAGVGLAVQPEFIVWRDLAQGRLEPTMPEWPMADVALNLVMPPGGLRPRRVTAVMDFLAARLAAAPWATV